MHLAAQRRGPSEQAVACSDVCLVSQTLTYTWSSASCTTVDNGPCNEFFQLTMGYIYMLLSLNKLHTALQVNINDSFVAEFESYAGPTFNTFRLEAEGVSTLSFRAIGLDEDEWTSLIEVSDSIRLTHQDRRSERGAHTHTIITYIRPMHECPPPNRNECTRAAVHIRGRWKRMAGIFYLPMILSRT